MSPILARYVFVALLVLMPVVSNAQTQPRPRTMPLHTASNDPVRLDAALVKAGPHLTSRGYAAPRRDRSRVLQVKDSKRDSVANGIAIGALTGALGGAALTASMYARCDGTCDAPAVSAVLFPTMGLGAGIGALIGYVIDRAR